MELVIKYLYFNNKLLIIKDGDKTKFTCNSCDASCCTCNGPAATNCVSCNDKNYFVSSS